MPVTKDKKERGGPGRHEEEQESRIGVQGAQSQQQAGAWGDLAPKMGRGAEGGGHPEAVTGPRGARVVR